jgi:adenylate cyclase
MDISNGNFWASSGIARTYALVGQKRKSEAILRDILNGAKNREDLAMQLAIVYVGQRENDQAFAWLGKAYQHREGGLILFNVVPEFQSLRGDPRFDDLLQRIGLPRSEPRRLRMNSAVRGCNTRRFSCSRKAT